MKIGNLEFKDYAAQKPLGITATGKFVTAEEIVAEPVLGLGSPFTLDTAAQIDLAVERYSLEPPFTLAAIDGRTWTRDEIIDEIKAKTPFGDLALRVEMYYVDVLSSMLAAPGAIPTWPVIPKPDVPIIPDWRKVKRCVYARLTNRVLFCENTTDSITKKFADYRIACVHPAFQARGFNVTALTGADDVRANFVPLATNGLMVYFGGIGHGAYWLYTGHMGDHILEIGHYAAEEVKGKSIHFLSCQTGRDLGPDAVAHGAPSYAGYTENFTFVWDVPGTAVNEWELFAEADSTYDLSMAAGTTALEAYNATFSAFDAAMARPGVPGTAAASWLLFDRDHLKLHGDPESKIQPWRVVKICFPLLAAQESLLNETGVLAG